MGSDGWRYCRTHGKYYDPGDDGCPRCQDAEEATSDQARESAEALADSDYRRANPGDHQCPNCLYITLKRGASRCPQCRGEISRDYWELVRTSEQAADKRRRIQEAAARAEWERAAPERDAKALQARQNARSKFIFIACYHLLVWCGCIVFILINDNRYWPGLLAVIVTSTLSISNLDERLANIFVSR